MHWLRLRTLGWRSLLWQMTYRRRSSTRFAGSASSPRRCTTCASRHSNCIVVNFSSPTSFCMQRAPVEEEGLPFSVVAPDTSLGVRIGPEAELTFWAKARLKFLIRVSHLRAAVVPARERLKAYASSVFCKGQRLPQWRRFSLRPCGP